MSIKVDYEATLSFSARDVWKLAGSFNGLPTISSGATGSILEDGGRIRVLTNSDGSMLWERLTAFSESEMKLSYEIIDAKGFEGRIYGVGYKGELRIHPITNESARFQYRAEFTPGPGYSEDSARDAVSKFAEDCVAGITRRLYFLQKDVDVASIRG